MDGLSRIPGGATEISHKSFRFLITERPNELSMGSYIEELKRFKVGRVVRVCEGVYDVERLESVGVKVIDLGFQDGQPPPQQIIDSWLELIQTQSSQDPTHCIAVHCVAGLGRAPVLVAIALMELGMKYEDAVELIRAKRRGAINAKQLSFLSNYKPKKVLNNKSGNNCIIV